MMKKTVRPGRFHRFANWALRKLFPLILRVRIVGLEHVPGDGPLVVAFNHTSFLDPPLLGAYIPRYLVPIAKAESFSWPVLGWLIRMYDAIPIRRGAVDREALRAAQDVLQRGDGLIVSPEGTRSKTHELLPPRGGLVFLTTRGQATVLPVGISGVGQFWHNFSRLRRTPVTMQIGPPFHFVYERRRPDRRMMAQMAEEAMYRLAMLLPPEQRGPYADLELATTQYIEVHGAN
ncbi:MAG: 1-acyl-sn-glycerol-3-phosphate acyltransferase [Chloroflexi bacterium]|nr:1-acyl-sn-glycerol-3-phosphate acyltransferase [Chloroflexota bacterium]